MNSLLFSNSFSECLKEDENKRFESLDSAGSRKSTLLLAFSLHFPNFLRERENREEGRDSALREEQPQTKKSKKRTVERSNKHDRRRSAKSLHRTVERSNKVLVSILLSRPNRGERFESHNSIQTLTGKKSANKVYRGFT